MNALSTLRTTNRLIGGIAPAFAAHVARGLLLKPHFTQVPLKWEAEALAQAEPITFRFGLPALRWGESGPVVLMMHGWGGRGAQFHLLAETLAARGFQAIALDGPAHGRSKGGIAHPLSFAEALLEAASELRDVRAAVGHSMGGASMLFALVEGLAVERAVAIAAASSMRGVLQRYARTLALPEAAARRFIQGYEQVVGRPADSLDIASMGHALRAEGLIVHDRDDCEVPHAESQRIAAAWRGARQLTTQGLGHNRVLRDAAVIAEIVGFIEGGSARNNSTQ
ncbi:MAG TPA: alpha/beta fold hydrolase [Xanthomonadaceae bacterium]|nr:alpha/beta fold hydrolase [Xanthomonadaceae bacterium]